LKREFGGNKGGKHEGVSEGGKVAKGGGVKGAVEADVDVWRQWGGRDIDVGV
jgi:hypothetical protein